MRLKLAAATTFLIAGLAALPTSPAAAGNPACQDVLAKAVTTWADEGVEVGEVEGLLNGAVYLRYDDKEPIDAAISKANMVITTKTGNLYLWVAGTSAWEPDSVTRELSTVQAFGTGEFARATIKLAIIGECYYGKDGGGSYEVAGTICTPTITPKRPR